MCHTPPPTAARHHTAHARTGAPPVSPAAHDTVSVVDVASAICTEGAAGGTVTEVIEVNGEGDVVIAMAAFKVKISKKYKDIYPYEMRTTYLVHATHT